MLFGVSGRGSDWVVHGAWGEGPRLDERHKGGLFFFLLVFATFSMQPQPANPTSHTLRDDKTGFPFFHIHTFTLLQPLASFSFS